MSAESKKKQMLLRVDPVIAHRMKVHAATIGDTISAVAERAFLAVLDADASVEDHEAKRDISRKGAGAD